MSVLVICFVFSRRRRHTRCALVTGFQTCALPFFFTECETPISLGPGASVQSTFDTFWGSESLIAFGNATSSRVLLSHSLVRSRHLMSLSVRSEEGRGGTECVSMCNFRWLPYH